MTPIALLTLAACRGGGGSDDTSASAVHMIGRAVKGPLENAFVFADINGNGSFDLGEPSSTTDSVGRFTLEGAGAATIIATTSANTIDQSSGVALNGLTLTAPSLPLVAEQIRLSASEAETSRSQIATGQSTLRQLVEAEVENYRAQDRQIAVLAERHSLLLTIAARTGELSRRIGLQTERPSEERGPATLARQD